MALSLGDAFLNFTAGAIERNNKIRDENVALALEDFKANKDLYQKIALDRYTRDSNRYDKELEKMDSLKSVYANIANNNYSRETAAGMILNLDPNFSKLSGDAQEDQITAMANSFKTKYKTIEEATADGVTSKTVEDGFEIIPENIKLNRPDMKAYLQDPSFWTKLQNEIKTGTGGPLTNQVLKLLGKENSGAAAEMKLNELEQKDGTILKTEGDGVEPVYSSNNDRLTKEMMTNNFPDGKIPGWLTNIMNGYSGSKGNDVKKFILSEHNALADIDFFTQQVGGDVNITDDGQFAYNQASALFSRVNRYLWDAMRFSGDASVYGSEQVEGLYRAEIKYRMFPLKNVAWYDWSGDIKGIYTIPTSILPIGATLESQYGIKKGDLASHMDTWTKDNITTGSLAENEWKINEEMLNYINANKKEQSELPKEGDNDGSKSGDNSSQKFTFNESQQEELNNNGIELIQNIAKGENQTVEEVISNLEASNYKISEDVKLLAPLEFAPSKFMPGNIKSRKNNPEYEKWRATVLPKWDKAMEYIRSIEPEKPNNPGRTAMYNNPYNVWLRKYNTYIKEYKKPAYR